MQDAYKAIKNDVKVPNLDILPGQEEDNQPIEIEYKQDTTPETLEYFKSQQFKLPIVSTKLNLNRFLYSDTPVTNAKEAVALVGEEIVDSTCEIGVALFMDVEQKPIGVLLIESGTMERVAIPVQRILQAGLLCNAREVIFMHNHVHLDGGKMALTPSGPDIKITSILLKACDLVGLRLIDSVIVAPGKVTGKPQPQYYSLKEHKQVKMKNYQISWKEALGIEANKQGTFVEDHLNFDNPLQHTRMLGLKVEEYIEDFPRGDQNCQLTMAYTPEEFKELISQIHVSNKEHEDTLVKPGTPEEECNER